MLRTLAILLSVITGSTIPLVAQNSNGTQRSPLGVFDSDTQIGNSHVAGTVNYNPADGSYSLSGSGDNNSLTADTLHFLWKQITGDMRLSADVVSQDGGDELPTAILMLRQDLDSDSVYAGLTLRKNGLAYLVYRDEKHFAARQIGTNILRPKRLSIEKRGDFIYISVGNDSKTVHFSGASIRIPLQGSFYAGMGASAPKGKPSRKAVFANVEIAADLPPAANSTLYSALERIDIASRDRNIVYLDAARFEAPNWTHDGTTLLFNRNGNIYRLPAAGGEPAVIDTNFANRCNNDHGISPDQTLLAISDQSQEDNKSTVYIVPIAGGTPRRITQNSPSYWHGWSPDGKVLAFVGQRNNDFDIYTIPVSGGEESRLTTAKGLDDGPEYSPDGKYIYFNSERTGHMQIWRMRPDGSDQEQVFSDELNNWFPHISPDGKWMVFLSFEPGVVGHPPNQNVMLRLMSLADKKVTVLTKLFGGQGTINVPSWSPDSKEIAFVSNALVPLEESAKK